MNVMNEKVPRPDWTDSEGMSVMVAPEIVKVIIS
jgi:hypothetical protein